MNNHLEQSSHTANQAPLPDWLKDAYRTSAVEKFAALTYPISYASLATATRYYQEDTLTFAYSVKEGLNYADRAIDEIYNRLLLLQPFNPADVPYVATAVSKLKDPATLAKYMADTLVHILATQDPELVMLLQPIPAELHRKALSTTRNVVGQLMVERIRLRDGRPDLCELETREEAAEFLHRQVIPATKNNQSRMEPKARLQLQARMSLLQLAIA